MNDKIKKETIVFLSKDGYRIELDKEKSIISETLIQLFEGNYLQIIYISLLKEF